MCVYAANYKVTTDKIPSIKEEKLCMLHVNVLFQGHTSDELFTFIINAMTVPSLILNAWAASALFLVLLSALSSQYPQYKTVKLCSDFMKVNSALWDTCCRLCSAGGASDHIHLPLPIKQQQLFN